MNIVEHVGDVQLPGNELAIFQVAAQMELHQHAQKYCAQLQDYNSRLQCDAQALTESLRSIQV